MASTLVSRLGGAAGGLEISPRGGEPQRAAGASLQRFRERTALGERAFFRGREGWPVQSGRATCVCVCVPFQNDSLTWVSGQWVVVGWYYDFLNSLVSLFCFF